MNRIQPGRRHRAEHVDLRYLLIAGLVCCFYCSSEFWIVPSSVRAAASRTDARIPPVISEAQSAEQPQTADEQQPGKQSDQSSSDTAQEAESTDASKEEKAGDSDDKKNDSEKSKEGSSEEEGKKKESSESNESQSDESDEKSDQGDEKTADEKDDSSKKGSQSAEDKNQEGNSGQDDSKKTKVMKKHIIGATAMIFETQSELLFRARVDSGAKSCSLHIEKLVIVDEAEKMVDNIGKTVKFKVKNHEEEFVLESRIEGYVVIKTADNKERRYKVPLTLRWNGVEKQVLVTLNNRGNMEYPLLLGRNFLRGDFLVDVELDSDD